MLKFLKKIQFIKFNFLFSLFFIIFIDLIINKIYNKKNINIF